MTQVNTLSTIINHLLHMENTINYLLAGGPESLK